MMAARGETKPLNGAFFIVAGLCHIVKSFPIFSLNWKEMEGKQRINSICNKTVTKGGLESSISSRKKGRNDNGRSTALLGSEASSTTKTPWKRSKV